MPRPSPRVRLNSPAPQTPPAASSLSHELSVSPSPQNSPSRKGPVESPFQRGFRNILKSVKTIVKNWDILLAQGCELFRKIEKHDKSLEKYNKQSTATTSLDIIKVLRTLEEDETSLFGVFDKITRQYQLLRAQNTQLQTLLADAATRRGLEHAFRDPLFLTWPLSRFCDSLTEVVHVYSMAYHTLRQYMPTLNEMPDNAYSVWKNCKPAQNPVILDFFEICDIELYIPDDQD